MAERFSLKDHLFNETTLGQLGREYEVAVPGFDADDFVREALSRFPDLELLARLEWMADCLQARLPPNFSEMAASIEAAMPPALDPTLTDDDFGQFIHAVPGILAVRHGLEKHHERALDLLHGATQRFSMEFYIRPFLQRWPDATLKRLSAWAKDPNYHVRRLVSEGSRPKLPWAKALNLDPRLVLPLLDALHADPTRYVTRSVANHLNDLTKTDPDLVLDRLEDWRGTGGQDSKELDWMTRHSLRTLVKGGHPRALNLLGFDPEAEVDVVAFDVPENAAIGGNLPFSVTLHARSKTGVIVDYVFWRKKADGKLSAKVFKLKQMQLLAGQDECLEKRHRLKGDATTYKLYPGTHKVQLQINGKVKAERSFELTA